MKKDLSPIYDLIRADGSIVINKCLSHAIGINETIIYSELLSRYNYFNIREELDEEGYFYNTADDLQLGTSLSAKQQKSAITNIEKLGLIKVKLKGVPAIRHFLLVDNNTLILDFIQKGKEKMKILSESQLKYREEQRKRRAEDKQIKENQLIGTNVESRCAKIDNLETQKGSVNNTNLNNTNLNNTNLFIQGVANATTTRSFPYIDYVTSILIEKDLHYKSEIINTIIYYYSTFKDVMGREHIRYRHNKTVEIIRKLEMVFMSGIFVEGGYIPIDFDHLKDMIDKHFNTTYKHMNHNLIAFLQEDVLQFKYLEVQFIDSKEVAEC